MTSTLADQLAAIDDQEFKGFVNQELRRREDGGGDELSDALRSPLLLRRFHNALAQILKSIEGQLSAREADYEAAKAMSQKKLLTAEKDLKLAKSEKDRREAERRIFNLRADLQSKKTEYLQGRARSLRFKSGVDMTFLETKFLLGESDDSAKWADKLELAIRRHRDEVQDPLPEDIELWAVLDA